MSASPTVHTPRQVAGRRASRPHSSMFLRMLIRAAVLRRGRAASALFAMVVAAAVATAMMNLYVDVQANLRTEFRNYGANVVVVAKESQPLPADALTKIESALGPKTLAVPFSYAVARTKEGQSVVVVGTDFPRARQLNHWWNVRHWPEQSKPTTADPRAAAHDNLNAAAQPISPVDSSAAERRNSLAQRESAGKELPSTGVPSGTALPALVGMRAATVVTPDRKPFELTFQGRTLQLAPAGLLQTGAGEDSRIPELDRRRPVNHRNRH